MGFYHNSPASPQEEEPRGCRDVFVLTRAAFGVLLIPFAILVGVILTFALIVYLFNRFWPLGVLALVAVGIGIYFYARWEQHHFRAP